MSDKPYQPLTTNLEEDTDESLKGDEEILSKLIHRKESALSTSSHLYLDTMTP